MRRYIAAVNGGLIHKDGTYVGDVIDDSSSNGKIQAIDPALGGGNFSDHNAVLGKTSSGEMKIFDYGDTRLDTTTFLWAIQNGPWLLKNGVNPHSRDSLSKKIRSGMGFTEEYQRLVYIKTNEPVAFYHFGELFRQENVANAIFLDGGLEEYVGFTVRDETGTTHTDSMRESRPVIQFFHATATITRKK